MVDASNTGEESHQTERNAIASEVYDHNRSTPPRAQPYPSNPTPLVEPPTSEIGPEENNVGESSAMSVHASDILAVDDERDESNQEHIGLERPKETVSLPLTTPPPTPPLPGQSKIKVRTVSELPGKPVRPPSTVQSNAPKSINSLLAGLSEKVSSEVEKTPKRKDGATTGRASHTDDQKAVKDRDGAN